jgi:hypothetical protein
MNILPIIQRKNFIITTKMNLVTKIIIRITKNIIIKMRIIKVKTIIKGRSEWQLNVIKIIKQTIINKVITTTTVIKTIIITLKPIIKNPMNIIKRGTNKGTQSTINMNIITNKDKTIIIKKRNSMRVSRILKWKMNFIHNKTPIKQHLVVEQYSWI